MADLRFYFDFTCPFAYLASVQVEDLARRTGARLDPRPMLLGGVFRARAVPQRLSDTLSPPKARHNLADMQRMAAQVGVPLHMPAGHPLRSVLALRCVLAVGEPFMPLAHAIYRAYWADGVDISDRDALAGVLTAAGHDATAVLARAESPQVKQELRARTDEAIAAGVFGIPTFVVGDELWWGVDRMYMVERALGGSPALARPAPRHPVDVYFDYSSPFAYLGCARAERLFGDRATWHPMLLGAVFRAVGQDIVPLATFSDAKKRYVLRDVQRQAEELGLPFRFPSRFPMRTTLPLRVTMLAGACDDAGGRELVHHLFRAYWAEDQDISDPAVVASICSAHGHGGEALVEQAQAPAAKAALRASTDAAVAAGVFGAPTFVVHTPAGPELFWGSDRAHMAAEAAAGDERLWTMAAAG